MSSDCFSSLSLHTFHFKKICLIFLCLKGEGLSFEWATSHFRRVRRFTGMDRNGLNYQNGLYICFQVLVMYFICVDWPIVSIESIKYDNHIF